MDWFQMKERCPSARFIGIAMLPNHALEFTRYSTNRRCGVADVTPCHGHDVWGVVYEIDGDDDLNRLNVNEGYDFKREPEDNSYNREEIEVLLQGDSDKAAMIWTYIANKQKDAPKPNEAYLHHLVYGAVFWQLPDDYIRELEHIEVDSDST
jgi:gamma-glutamylcyclotransferase